MSNWQPSWCAAAKQQTNHDTFTNHMSSHDPVFLRERCSSASLTTNFVQTATKCWHQGTKTADLLLQRMRIGKLLGSEGCWRCLVSEQTVSDQQVGFLLKPTGNFEKSETYKGDQFDASEISSTSVAKLATTRHVSPCDCFYLFEAMLFSKRAGPKVTTQRHQYGQRISQVNKLTLNQTKLLPLFKWLDTPFSNNSLQI